jgi:adenylate cyclase, class 2
MTVNKLEQEAKFWINRLDELEDRLRKLGAVEFHKRTFELNLRFDDADRKFSREYKVLRLRQDQKAHLTYKGPGDPSSAVASRAEIEIEVSDFDTARRFLEALGYQVTVIYEKYRADFHMDNVEVTLDEMPYGTFSEIEGPDEKSIRAAADKLGLNWEARSKLSYLAIFAAVKKAYSLEIQDLTFDAFAGQAITLEKIGLSPAD